MLSIRLQTRARSVGHLAIASFVCGATNFVTRCYNAPFVSASRV